MSTSSDPTLVHRLTRNIGDKLADASDNGGTVPLSGASRLYKGTVTAINQNSGSNLGWVQVQLAEDASGRSGSATSPVIPSMRRCVVGDVVLVTKIGNQMYVEEVLTRDFTVYEIGSSYYEFGTGFSNYGSPGTPVRAWLDSDNHVHLGGLLGVNPSALSGLPTQKSAFSLPPAWSTLSGATCRYPCLSDGSGVFVEAQGSTVAVQVVTGMTFVWLDGITFPVAF